MAIICFQLKIIHSENAKKNVNNYNVGKIADLKKLITLYTHWCCRIVSVFFIQAYPIDKLFIIETFSVHCVFVLFYFLCIGVMDTRMPGHMGINPESQTLVYGLYGKRELKLIFFLVCIERSSTVVV